MMEQGLKAKWLAALRSGEYEQTTNALKKKDGSGFCCLGVLCDVIDPFGWKEGPWITAFAHRLGNERKESDVAFLSQSKSQVPGELQQKLAKMNDSGTPFTEIADFIEGTL